MNGDFLGGGIVFAISAVLWLVYLVPALWRKHTFDATEKNAVRLNQTLRALVETSETPQEVRLEATARAVAQQQRILRKAEARARRQMRAATLRSLGSGVHAGEITRSAVAPRTPAAPLSPSAPLARSVTRSRQGGRLAASLLLFVSLGVVAWGAVTVATNGQWGFIAGGIFGVGTSALILRTMAPGSARTSPAAQQARRPTRRRIPDATVRTASGWVPTQIPAPLTARAGSLARSTVEAQRAREQLLRDAAIDAAVAAQSDRATTTSRFAAQPVSAPTAPPESQPAAAIVERERLASMGLVGNTGTVELDLTEALRRRRTGS